MNLGSYEIDQFVTWCVQTSNPTTGAAADADGGTPPAYRIYEDETGTPILTGSMALLDASNTDGLYSEQIQATAANGFELGKCYTIRCAATVGSVAGATLRHFQIGASVNVTRISDDQVAANNLELAFDDTQGEVPWMGISRQGAASAVNSTTITIDSSEPFADNTLTGSTILVKGTATAIYWQAGLVTAFNHTTHVATVTWASGFVAPTGTLSYKIFATAAGAGAGGGGLDAAGVRAAIGMSSANLDSQLSSIASKIDTVDDFVDTEVAAILAAVDTEVAAILAKVNNLPSDPADASDIASAFSTVNGTLSTIASYIDTEVGAIKAKTDTIPTWPTNFASLAIDGAGNIAIADGYLTAAKHAAGFITATGIATGAFTAAKFAAGAIDANALATDAANEIAAAVRDIALLDTMAGLNALPTIGQALRVAYAAQTRRVISGTTETLRKEDGSTTLLTSTLNDATNPTSILRAT